MSDDIQAEEIAEALLCIAKLILLMKKLGFADDEGWLLELEDELSELHQETR